MSDNIDIENSVYGSKTPLRIGDYIVLRLSKPEDGWLSSPGLLDDNCFATTNPDHFENCIWEIHVQNQYSAAKEFKEALVESIKNAVLQDENSVIKKTTKSIRMEKDNLNQLKHAALNEQRLNEKLMGLRKGKPIAFGDPIQLRHVKSQKFLTISVDILAREERENLKVYLEIGGDSLSCLGFMPRYRFDKEGHILTNHSEVMIRVHERGGEYLHAAKPNDISNLNAKVSEVNCSLEASFWTIVLYQRVEDLKGSTITAGQLITLQDPDSLCCLTVERKGSKGEKPKITLSSQFQLRDLRPGSTTVGTHLLWFLEKSDVTTGGPISLETDEVALRDLNSGLYMRLDEFGLTAVKHRNDASLFEFRTVQSKSLDSNFLQDESTVHLVSKDLWVSYTNDGSTCEGSTSKSRAIGLLISSVLFKRLGVHLHVGVQACFILKSLVKVAHDFEHRKTDIHEVTKCLRVSYGVLDSLTTFLAFNEEQSNDDLTDINITTDKDLLSFRQHMLREQGLIDIILDLLILTERTVFENIQNPVVARDTQRSLKRLIKKDSIADKDADLDKQLEKSSHLSGVHRRRGSFQLLPGAIFTKGGVNAQNITTSVGSEKSVKIDKRGSFTLPTGETAQSLARRISNSLPIRNPDLVMNDASDEEDEDDDLYGVEAVKEHKSAGHHLSHHCLKVLLNVIVNNPKNQLYVADRFPVLLAQVQEHRVAVLCVEELLKENLSILQTKVRQREIDIFVELLAQYEMSVTFLRLLQSTCSCPMGVDATQRMVTHALFGFPNLTDEANVLRLKVMPNTSGEEIRRSISIRFNARPRGPDRLKEELSTKQRLVIKIHPDRKKLTPVEWHGLSLYCPIDPEDVIIGYSELKGGIPDIWLSWAMRGKEDEFSMQALFGYKDRVPLALVCSALRKNSVNKLKNRSVGNSISKALRRKAQVYQKKQSNGGKNVIVSTGNNRSQVAEYFNTQLFLVADLCLDRNYVAMIILESLYPYDLMVATLKTAGVSSSIKAAVCRIIRCLYVDREPQVEARFPRLIRTSLGQNQQLEISDDALSNNKDQYKFALLQLFLSEYISNRLDLRFCDELSVEMLKLLQALVSFSFYRTVPQILDVLKPLVRILDEKRMDPKQEEDSFDNEALNLTGWEIITYFTSPSERKVLPEDSQNESSSNESYKQWQWLEKWAYLWQAYSESLLWLSFVILVVFASVAIAIVQLFSDAEFIEFFFATTFFFFLEIVVRYVVHCILSASFISFFYTFFNSLDVLLVCLDVELVTISLISDVQPDTVTRSLRVLRLLRLLRLIRAIRLVRKMTTTNLQKTTWRMPKRYLTVKKYEAKTMNSMLHILSMFYDRIQDQTLDVAIKAFSFWYQEVKADRYCDPSLTFQKMMTLEERISTELSLKFDQVLLDTLMYSDVELTKEAIRLLMVHKSQRDIFFEIAEKIQIVYSPRVAGICRNLSTMIAELQRLGEMFEIWSDLETPSDLEKANRVKDVLVNIKNYVGRKNEDKTLCMRGVVLVDEEVQNILRNLDVMNVFITLQEALFDGGREELKPMIRDILKLCNDLICLFVKNSEANQAVAFQYLEWFVERVNSGINSSKVLRAILEGNKDLIKKCPRSYLTDFARKIISDGRKPEYLDLFVGMTENSALFGSRVLSIESEICGYLTAREWKKYILIWCSSKDSEEYFERRLEMERCNSGINGVTSHEDLSPLLQYHIRILILLANCNLGPRLHAIYPIGDVLAAILDRNTIFPVKKELCRLLICMLSMSIDRAERSENFWDLLDVIIHTLDSLPNEISTLSKGSNALLRIQKGEWTELCAGIVSAFFERFEVDAYTAELKIDHRSGRSALVDPRVTMQKLYKSIRNVVDHHAGKLGHALTEELNFASAMINRQLDQDSQHGDDGDVDTVGTKLQLLRMQHQRSSVVFADVQQTLYRKQFSSFLGMLKQQSKDSKEDVIFFFRSIPRVSDPINSDVRFEPLVKKLTTHFRSMINKSSLSRALDSESLEACSWIIKSFRYMVEAELHFTCDNIYEVDDYNGIIPESTELNKLRKIFNENGVVSLCMDLIAVGIDHTIYIEAMKLLIALLFHGGGVLSLQQTIYRYLVGTDSFLFFELLKELIENLKAWTMKENDAIHDRFPVERSAIHKVPEDIIVFYLLQGFCEGSFIPIRDQIREQRGNSKLVGILELLASYVGILSKTENICNAYLATVCLKTILRLVQGPARGNQDQFVLHSELLISLNRIIRDTRPSFGRTSSNDLIEYQENLKESVVDVIRAVIEGHYEASLVYDRVSTTIDINVLHLLIFPQNENSLSTQLGTKDTTIFTNYTNVTTNNKLDAQEPVGSYPLLLSSSLSHAQAKYLVLVKHLGKALDTFQGNEQIEALKDEITSVEVVFEQQVHTVYFHIPDFIKDISMESKNRVIEDVKNNATGSRELKLADFVKHCRKLYRESVHQQFLKNYGLAQLWTVKYFLTRFMFVNAIILNVLIQLYYGSESNGHDYYAAYQFEHPHDDDDDQASANHTSATINHRYLSSSSSTTTKPDHLFIAPEAKDAVIGLCTLQLVCVFCTVVIFAIVRIPVRYATDLEKNSSAIVASIRASLDPLILWYLGYVLMAFLALEVNPLFVTVFLLDFVILDNTSQDLLQAVLHPIRQLTATLGMILIALNVFAFSVFALYRHDVTTLAIHNMWEALKLCISYGFRGEYGVDHEMNPTLGDRMLQDVLFYFLVLSILRHIFFAIIVDTFGKLRELKFERESEAKNSCFICGVERHDYDRMLPPGVDFSFNDHRNLSHNPLHYLYFIMSIWHQPKAKDSSLEIHVRRCLSRDDVHWFPTGVLHELPSIDDSKRVGDPADFEEGHFGEKKSLGSHASTQHHSEGGAGGGSHGISGAQSGVHVSNSPHHDSQGNSAKVTRQNSIFGRKSLLLVTNQESSSSLHGMSELMEKMTIMQKQIVKLSKDIYQNAGRDRINSNTGPSFQSITSEMNSDSVQPPPVSLTNSPQIGVGLQQQRQQQQQQQQQQQRTALVNQRTPFQSSLHRSNSDEVSSESTYSSTEDSEDREEIKLDQNSGEKASLNPSDLKEGSPINGERSINPDGKNPSPESLTKKSMKRQNTTRSSMSKSTIKKSEKELRTKVDMLDETLQLIMKKLEVMENRLTKDVAIKASPHSTSPIEPEVNSGNNSNPQTNEIKGDDLSELSEHSERIIENQNNMKRPQSAQVLRSLDISHRDQDTGDSNDEFRTMKIKAIPRPQSAHPYSHAISAHQLNTNFKSSPTFVNSSLLSPFPSTISRGQHSKNKTKPSKSKDPDGKMNSKGFSGPPKSLVSNWIDPQDEDHLVPLSRDRNV